jgi:hypothetical protein
MTSSRYSPSYSSSSYPASYSDDSPSLPFAIVSFIIPIVGIILYYVHKGTSPRKANSAIKGAGCGIAVNLTLMCLPLLTLFGQSPSYATMMAQGSPWSSQAAVTPVESDVVIIAKRAMGALIQGKPEAERLIDWRQLRYMRQDMGESYGAVTSRQGKAESRQRFIKESFASLRKKGVKPQSLTNWQVQSQELSGTLVTCTLPDGNTLAMTISGDKLTSVQG